MNIETPEELAKDLARLNPDVVAATCGQLFDITPRARRVGMGQLVMTALFEPILLERLVKAGVMGEAIAELESRQILPMHFQGACSKISDQNTDNDDDLMYCRAAGQIWKSSPTAYQRTYPTSRLWNDEGDWHIMRYAAILTKSYVVIKKRPGLINVEEAMNFISSVIDAKEDICGLLDGVAQQCLFLPKRISRGNSLAILDTLGWLHSENEKLPKFNPNSIQILVNTIVSDGGGQKITPLHRRAISCVRRSALDEISSKKTEQANLPRI